MSSKDDQPGDKRIRYTPSWSQKSPCIVPKRSKLTVCGGKTPEKEQKKEGVLEETRKSDSEMALQYTEAEWKAAPAFSWDDLAIRNIAPPAFECPGSAKGDEIKFYIPHKRILQTFKYTVPELEPLPGYLDSQNQRRRRKILVHEVVEEELPAIKIDRESKKIKTPPANLVNIKELINKMTSYPNFRFVYLVYGVPRTSEFFTPFAYKVVEYDQITSKHYLTVSTEGVMSHSAGEMSFTCLREWEKEYDFFCKLTEIRIFKQYRLWKSFFVWKKAVNWGKYMNARTKLALNLFMLNPVLKTALLEVRVMCVTLETSSFPDLTKTEDFKLFEFMELQMEKLENVMEKLTEFREIVKNLISTACHGALMVEGFTTDDSNLRASQCGVSQRKWKEGPPKMSYTEQANKRRVCERLSNFINLIDYQLVELYHAIVLNSLRSFWEAFEKHLMYMPSSEALLGETAKAIVEIPRPPSEPQHPFFVTDAYAEIDKLIVDPSEEVFVETIQGLLDLYDQKVIDFMPLVQDPFFLPFIEPVVCDKHVERLIGEGPSLVAAMQQDYSLQEYKAKIIEGLRTNFVQVERYLRQLDDIQEFYRENCLMNRNLIMNETRPAQMREYLQKYHDQIEVLKTVKEKQEMGLITLLLEDFRNEILPSPQELLSITEKVVPKLASSKVEALTKECSNAIDYLEIYPNTTTEFVKHLEFIDEISARLEGIEAEIDYAKEIHDIIEEFEVPVTSEEVEAFYNFASFLTTLRNLCEKKLADKVNLIEKFNNQLSKDISSLIKEVGLIQDESVQDWLIQKKSNPNDCKFTLKVIVDQLADCQRRAREIKSYQKQFKMEVTKFEMLEDVLNDVRLRQLLWDSLEAWGKASETYNNGDFNALVPEDVITFVTKTLKNIGQLDKGLPKNDITPDFKEEVERFREKIPVIVHLRNQNLRHRHWQKIEGILNYKFSPTEVLTLKKLEELDVFRHLRELQEVSSQASSEAALENLLKKVEDSWKGLEFIVLLYRDTKDVFILGSLEEIQQVLDDCFISVNTILSSRHVGPIKAKVEEWSKTLDLFSKTLDEWWSCQSNWLYLESIFSAPDIQRQLPNEARMFVVVDKSFKDIMRWTNKHPLALPAATRPGVLETFQNNNKLLDQILKCLEAYLESKRVVFPRFYFLSNEELLEILAQARNPHAVQPHLRKCFDAISKLEFGVIAGKSVHHTSDILAMVSPEGESVPLGKGLKARGNVEDWLGKVEESMMLSLKKAMKFALLDHLARDRTVWVLSHASQIILTVSQIMWCKNVHKILDGNDNKRAQMAEFEKKNFSELNRLAVMVRGSLTKLGRLVLCSLITIDVHARDNVTNLVNEKVTSSNSFEWLKCLRYYWDEKIDNCVARMSNAYYVYGYEYLGASPRLVITPLTDKCYLCLMGALQLDLGGAPAGPAGTGKTETTKDLAKSLAIQCVVFNCSEGLDYKMMGRFFSGLAQSGAWCCFDEFNRIDIEVLSVIAQQLITIRNAKAAKLTRFMFEGREIKLVHQCAAFITMNPGYAGRTELPDNLKSLFRPMAMMVPDYALIAEVILYSEGFESSKVLAHKMTQMYKLCSEQLSLQDHYDFGMRAVKSVLVMAGALKRENPDINENVVLIRALRDSNIPKFLSNDSLLFQGILGDLFPGVTLPEQDYGAMETVIIEVMQEALLQPEPCMIKKVIQFYETMLVRHGVMLVGPTGGGKTTVLNTLKNTLTRLFELGVENPNYRPVQTYVMNPKSITIGELYGEFNLLTMEWKDGVLGIAVRTAVQCQKDDHQWVVCDGPVDAVWIENMNTVLDDNKMLCLANSERIKLTPYVHMVFEVMDLAQASPATVSRCGMVYIDPEELRWMPYVKTWLKKLPESIGLVDDLKEYLLKLFSTHVDDCLYFIKKNCTFGIHQVEISKVTAMCKLLEAILLEPQAIEKVVEKAKNRTLLCQTFVFCLVWALGGNMQEQHRDLYDTFLRSMFEEHEDAMLSGAADLWGLYIDIPKKRMEPWNRIIPEFAYEAEVPFFEILVPTQDTVRFGYLLEKLLSVDQAVMFTGQTGVGKSVITKAVLKTVIEERSWVAITLNFSAQTSSARTQEMIEVKLDKKKKTLLGAPLGKKVIVFVDDVNMPKLDTYGSQPPIELLRQYLDFGGLYDREKLFWKEITDVILCTACAPPGGGRNPLTPRFVRHFSMFEIPSPSETALKMIFRAIMNGFFEDFVPAIQELANPLVNAATEIYDRISTDLLPTPAKSHYVFNLRDLSKCIQGTLQADPGSFRETTQILRLFYHECLRVFQDRLINKEDKTYFYFLMREVCSRCFGNPILFFDDEGIVQEFPVLIFGDFMKISARKEDRIYEEITNITKLRAVLQDYLDDFNMMYSKHMRINFFMDAIEHCVRLARILRAERGNGLLVGVGGMGKQSLTKLGSHLNGYKCFQIELTRSYDHVSFQDDLRKLCFSAGAKGEDMAFLFTDSQIVQEEFLEDINNILNSGEVPNLFEGDDYEKVINTTRPFALEMGIPENKRDEIFGFFISRLRGNLHLVLCMSPIGDAFRRRCRMFPSLVNCCTIDWFLPWPTEALLSVAEQSFEQNVKSHEMANRLALICVTMHESVQEMTIRLLTEKRRYYYTTPSSYLELLKIYKLMLKRKTEETIKLRERIANGLKKLYETNSLVDGMKKELLAYEPKLKAKSTATNALMANLTKEQEAADKVRKVVLSDEAVAKVKAAETQELADDAQKDLAEAMPAMEMAMKALQALNKNDINELKVFNKPPELVRVVMEAVCLLLGVKQDWPTAKWVLGDVNFLKRLQEYDKDHMSESMLRALRTKYINNPDFVPEKVVLISKVCKSLCMWVRAIDVYAKVYKVVEPKRKALEAAENELNAILSLLREKQRKLSEVEAQIAALEAKFDASMAEKAELEAAMALTSARLVRSGRLTSALADEQVRWEEQVQMYTEQLHNMVGDVLLGAGCMSYHGAFPSDFREELTQIWLARCEEMGIPASKNFSLIKIFADPYEIRTWNSQGLPRDNISTENAVLVTKSQKWPLMIDPQEQANRWVRNMEAENGLKICKLTDANYMRILENCIRIGMPALLEEIGENLDPSLRPILMRQTFTQGGRTLIRLGETDVEYDPNFKFYMTTKLSNPHYMPDVCILVTLVNFTVTPSGLEDQLLADVVRLERPDLEKTRTELITRINNDKMQLKNIEDKILRMLFTSTGNILDDEELIDALNESKETTEVIASRLAETEATEEKISIARNKYKDVATRGSVLFFVVAQLGDVDPMYQYSLKYYSQLFNNVIETTEKLSELSERLQLLIDEITLAVYINISRGLFERHKLVFSFMLCISIMQHMELIPDPYWNFLLRGVPAGLKVETLKKPEHPALTENIWQCANYLSQNFPNFKDLELDVLTRIRIQLGDYDHTININVENHNESEKPWDTILDNLEKLVIFKALREEKLVFAITEFVKENLGKTFVESPQIDLHSLYQDTSKVTPLVFILSTGSDPMGAFQRFAGEKNYSNRIQAISLGQGQGPIAEKMLKEASLTGDWVFLQNCHLATSWMLPMERKIAELTDTPEKVHDDFRIFLSSMPTKSFPVSVLQNSVKVTNEPPKGIRANMKRAFFEMAKSYFDDHPLESNWRKMVFGICFFHAIIQERKKFGPLGWNITYEFNDSDRECALLNLQMFCTDTSIPWDALEYTTGEITYGGRVTDGWDQRCLKTILKGYFSPATLAPGYKYSESGTYYCPEGPNVNDLETYREFIENLPIIEEPEIFGMHENANIAFQTKETQAVILTILDVQPRESAAIKGKTADEIAYDLAQSIKERIIQKIDPDKATESLLERDPDGRLASLTTVLFQETDRFNKLLRVLHSSLSNLQKAIKGLLVMSEQLEEIYKAFTNNQVPKMWERVAYPSLKTLGSWVRDLEIRLNFIQTWILEGPPLSFWLSGFFFPQGFLTGVLQTYARKYKTPIDQLHFDFVAQRDTVDQEEIERSRVQNGKDVPGIFGRLTHHADGVLVHGLFLDAARWDFDTNMLTDPYPGEMNPPLPALLVQPQTKVPSSKGRYVCPLYKTSVRAGVLSTTGHSTNFVVPVLLPTNRNESVWIIKGTALLTQITD